MNGPRIKLSVVRVTDERGVPYMGLQRASDQKIMPKVGYYFDPSDPADENRARGAAAAYGHGWLAAGGEF